MFMSELTSKLEPSADNFLQAIRKLVKELDANDNQAGKELHEFIVNITQIAVGIVNTKIKTDSKVLFAKQTQ
jgi:hypothetical protein